MFEKLKRLKIAAGFIGGRVEDYGRLAALDAAILQKDIVQSLIGFGIVAIALLFLAVFISVAVIVTAWETEARILTAWLVCLFWFLIGAGGFVYARGAFKGPPPFQDLKSEFAKDVTAIKELL
jgi:hypothetical protein